MASDPQMSPNAHVNNNAHADASGAQGIRLPPISFLSGAQNAGVLASMVVPSGSPAFQGADSKSGDAFFRGSVGTRDSASKMSLPQPQPLNLYPKRNSAHAHSVGSMADNNGIFSQTQNGFHAAAPSSGLGEKPLSLLSSSVKGQPHHNNPQNDPHQQQHDASGSKQKQIFTEDIRHQHKQRLHQPQHQEHPHQPQPQEQLHQHHQQERLHQHHQHHHHHYQEPHTHYEQQKYTTQKDSHSSVSNTRSDPLTRENPSGSSQGLSHRLNLDSERAIHIKRQKRALHSRLYTQLARDFPTRRHLGTLLYNPTTTWESMQIGQLVGLKEKDRATLKRLRSEFIEHKAQTSNMPNTLATHVYLPVIPPLPESYINSFLEVKIPYLHLKQFLQSQAQGQAEKKRVLWGGHAGIYTDDSDILYVLCHLGLFAGALDLTECNADWDPSHLTRPATVFLDNDGFPLLDISVTVLLLPALESYRGFYRHGLNSRSWQDKAMHNGLSIAIHSVKWESFSSATADRALSKRTTAEYIADKDASSQVMAQKSGWQFDLSLSSKSKKPGSS